MQVASHVSDSTTDDYIERCHQAMNVGTKIIYTPFNNDTELENDGNRINSVHYQMYTSGVFDYVIEKNLLSLQYNFTHNDILHLSEWDWNTRMARVQWLLQEPEEHRSLLQHERHEARVPRPIHYRKGCPANELLADSRGSCE